MSWVIIFKLLVASIDKYFHLCFLESTQRTSEEVPPKAGAIETKAENIIVMFSVVYLANF